MAGLDQKSADPAAPGKAANEPRGSVTSRLDHFEKRQNELWRLTFLLLFILSVVLAWTSWDAVRQMAQRLEALPIGLVVLVVLFGVYFWTRRREMTELRELVRSVEHGGSSEQHLNQLFAMVEQSQQGYRELIDSFDDVLLAVNLEGNICAANRSFAELVGTPFQEIIGRNLNDFLEDDGESRNLAERGLPRFIERRQWSGTVRLRVKGRPAPSFFDCLAHAMLRDGAVSGVTILARDITAQRENEARFTQLFESLQEGIYIATAEGQIVDANPALVRLLGYSAKEEVLSRNVGEVFAGPHGEAFLPKNATDLEFLQYPEITLRRKDGAPAACLHAVSVVKDAGGNVLRYQGALMDITERRAIERRLHKEQEFARRLVDSLPDLILVVDTVGNYSFVSPRFKEILGIDLNEEKAADLGAQVHAEDLPALQAAFQGIVAGQQTDATLEARVRNKQGDWRRILAHLGPLCNETGTIDGVIVSGRDITEVKRLEEQLIQSEKLAAMGQMLAGVAHELNNPLTAVLGITELLRDRMESDPTTRRQLEVTHRQARRAARIVQNLLEFSRPPAPLKKSLDVNVLIERSLQLHEHSLRRSNVAVDFRAHSGLPPVIGDANQLIHVFLNLLGNAEQAIHEVHEAGRIEIRVARKDAYIAVTIRDNGIGIPADVLPKLFDPFFTTRRPAGGTGLGLSISMTIVREHQGSIEAESPADGGSIFTVLLPIAEGQLLASTPEDGAKASPAEPPEEKNQRPRAVLVVDDEEDIRQILQEGLSARGMNVDGAGGADEALTLVARREYDAILCDVNLGAGAPSGKETAMRLLQASGARRPLLVLMSGDLMDPAEANGSFVNVRCLQKPFRISEVAALLNELLVPAGTAVPRT